MLPADAQTSHLTGQFMQTQRDGYPFLAAHRPISRDLLLRCLLRCHLLLPNVTLGEHGLKMINAESDSRAKPGDSAFHGCRAAIALVSALEIDNLAAGALDTNAGDTISLALKCHARLAG